MRKIFSGMFEPSVQSMNRTAPWSKLRLPIRGTPFLMWR